MDKFYSKLVGKNPQTFLSIHSDTIDSEFVIAEFIKAHINLGTLAFVYSNKEHLALIEAMLSRYGIAFSDVPTKTPYRGIVYVLSITDVVKTVFDSLILYLFRNVEYIQGCLKFATKDKLVITNQELVFPLDRIVFYGDKEVECGYQLYKLGYLKYMVKFFQDLFTDDESAVGSLFETKELLMDAQFMGYVVRIPSFSYSYLYETFRMTQNRTMIIRFLETHLKDLLIDIQKKNRFHLTSLLLVDFNNSNILKICSENNLAIFAYLTPQQREELFKKISGDLTLLIMAINLKIWNYSTIYKYSIGKEIKVGMDFLDFNLQNLLKEVDFNCDFGIIPNIISDFNNDKIIEIAYNFKMRMFVNIEDEIRETIFMNIKNEDSIEKGIALGIWTYRSIYIYFIKHLVDNEIIDSFVNKNLVHLIKEIEDNKDYALASHLPNDFALLDVMDISRKVALLFDTETRKQLYMIISDNPDYIRDCFELELWKLSDMYRYYIEYGKCSGETYAILNENLPDLVNALQNEGDYSLIGDLLVDFDAKDVLLVAKKIGSGVLVSIPKDAKDKLLVIASNDERTLQAGMELDLWEALEVYVYGYEHQECLETVKKVLSNFLRKLIIEIDGLQNDKLFSRVFIDFDIAVLYKEAAEYGTNIFTKITDDQREKIIIGICDDEKLIKWGIENNIFTMKMVLRIVGEKKLKMTKYARYNISDILFETDDKDLLARLIIESDVEEEALALLKKKFKLILSKDLKTKIVQLRASGVTKDPILNEKEFKEDAMTSLLSTQSLSKKEEKKQKEEQKHVEKKPKVEPIIETKQNGKKISDVDISFDELLSVLDEENKDE